MESKENRTRYFTVISLFTLYLLGLHDKETLINSPHFGHLFETLVITDFLKRFLHFGQMPSLYYLRTRDGLEVDLVIELGPDLHLFEIKSAMTIFPKHAEGLSRIKNDLGSKVKTASLITPSPTSFFVKNEITNFNWKDLLGG